MLLQDLAHADPQHLLILVTVQQLLAAGVASDPGQPCAQFAFHLLPRSDDSDHLDVLQHGEEVLVLHPEEVFPQEIACAEELCHRGDYFLLLQLVEHLFHRPAGPDVGQDLVDQLVEMFQGLGGIWRPGQQVGKLLDERDDESQFLEFPRIGDLRSAPVGHLERILYLDSGGRDIDASNVDVTQRQGGRQGVQKRRRVLARDAETGRPGPGVVVDRHMHREHGGGLRFLLATEVVHDALVDPSLQCAGAVHAQTAHGVLDFQRYGGPVRRLLRRRVHPEDIHDLSPGTQRRRGDARRRGRSARANTAATLKPGGPLARIAGRFRVGVGEYVPAAYAQSVGRQESRQDGNHREVIEGHDGKAPRRIVQGLHVDLRGVVRSKPADHPDVAPDHFGLVSLEIGRRHPADMIPDHDIRQVIALELFRKFRERYRIRHALVPGWFGGTQKLLRYKIHSTLRKINRNTHLCSAPPYVHARA